MPIVSEEAYLATTKITFIIIYLMVYSNIEKMVKISN